MKKILAVFCFVLVLGFSFLALSACEKELPDDLYIEGTDVTDVAAGEYALPYTVHRFTEYEDKYDLSLSVSVYDSSNREVAVQNNRKITVKEDQKYTVIVMLYATVNGSPVVKSHEFFITAAHAPRLVLFLYDDGEAEASYSVPYGGSLSEDKIPKINDVYPSDTGGYTRIVSKKWVTYDENDVPHDLTVDMLTNITKGLDFYASFEYETVPVPCVVSFDTDGGEEVPDFHTDSQTIFTRPTVIPKKDGFVFLGWCLDEKRSLFYDWTKNATVCEDMTLYALYMPEPSDPTPSSAFDFVLKTDEYGNPYYSIKAKSSALSGDVVLPASYRDIPVCDIEENGFEFTRITSVFIPSLYRITGQKQFNECTSLVSVTFENGTRTSAITPRCFYGCTSLASIEIPLGVMTVQPYAFYGCVSLKTVVLPNSVTSLNSHCFEECKSLETVSVPDSVLSILDEAFKGSTNLSSVLFGAKSRIQIINSDAFDDTKVTELKLPYRASMQEIFTGDVEKITVTFYPQEQE